MDYDINPIIVYTAYSYKQMKEYQFYYVRRIRFFYYVITAVLIAYWIIYLQPFTLDHILALRSSTMFIPAFSLTFGTLFGLGAVSFAFNYTEKIHNTTTVHLQNGQTCFFRNNAYDMEMHHSDVSGKVTYNYSVLTRAVETKRMFYLHTDKRVATLIDKNGFKSGTPEDLRQLLLRNLTASKCKFIK